MTCKTKVARRPGESSTPHTTTGNNKHTPYNTAPPTYTHSPCPYPRPCPWKAIDKSHHEGSGRFVHKSHKSQISDLKTSLSAPDDVSSSFQLKIIFQLFQEWLRCPVSAVALITEVLGCCSNFLEVERRLAESLGGPRLLQPFLGPRLLQPSKQLR